MKFEEKTLSQDYLYRGKIINLRRDTVALANGREALREVVEHPGGVCVAALTGQGEVLMVEQFRYPYRKALLELPAGKLEKGEESEICGRRELSEETGARAEKFISLGQLYPSPGYCAEIIHIYAALGLSFGKQALDEDEFLDVKRIKLEDAVNMVLENSIKDAKTQAALLKLYLLRDRFF